MLRHRALHERSEVRPRMLVNIHPSPGPSNSPPKRPQIQSPQSFNSPSVKPNILPEEPETRILYLRHWDTIHTEETTGNRIQDRYNFILHDITAVTFPEMVRRILTQQSTAFTTNVSFGFMWRNVEVEELRYSHLSQTNARFFDVPHWIRNEENIDKCLPNLSRQQHSNTKWVVHLLTNVTFYVNKLLDHPIGGRVVLPDHILKNKAVVALVGGSNGPDTDNLCFFRCLAIHRGAPDVKALETPGKTYYRQDLQQQDMTSADFKGYAVG